MIRHAVRQATTYVAVIGDAKQAACRLLRRPCETEFRALPLLVEPGSHCIDVGANRGQSIEALHLYGQTRITALEPQATLAERLTRRFRSVRVIQAGAGERHEELTLHTPVYNGYAFDGLASVQSDGLDDWLRRSLWRFDENSSRCARSALRSSRSTVWRSEMWPSSSSTCRAPSSPHSMARGSCFASSRC